MKYKKLIFSVLTVFLSGLAWYFFSKVFSAADVIRGQGLNWALFFGFEALSCAMLQIVSLAKDRYDFWLTSLISALWIPVFMGISLKTLISAAALFVGMQVIMEFPLALERTLKIRYFVTSYSKTALIILAIIGITSAYLQDRIAGNIQSEGLTQKTTNYAWPYLSKYLAQFDSEETVNNYLRDQFRAQGLANPTPSMVAQERNSMADQIGFPLNGNETMSDVGKRFVATRIGELLKDFNLNKAGLLVIFFSLLILWPIFRFLFALTSAVLAWILRRAGAIKMVEGQITTQKLEL